MEVVGTSEVTLVGNSIGCVACLSAAALLQDTKGLVLLNSAGNLEIEEEVRVASASSLGMVRWLTRSSMWLGCLGGTDEHSDGGIRRTTRVR
jgi:pimeloyl-ACP methyl ester carboxylesterase